MQQPTKILFIHLGHSSFVTEDLKILRSQFDVCEFHFRPSRTFLVLMYNFSRQFFWLLRNIWSARICYCWFSDYHGILPLLFARLFNIPFVSALGGFDCNRNKELRYGIFCSWWRAPLGKYILRKSTLLLPVDDHLISTDIRAQSWNEAHPNGVKHHVRDFKTPWKTLPTGYEPELWKAGPSSREKIVSTAGLVANEKTALIKGWDLFIEAAKITPDFKFVIVGCDPAFKKKLVDLYAPSENVSIREPVLREELPAIYQQSSVYAQLSRSEGLPNVLCEAMLCGCVPVGSPVYGIPTAIGPAGFIAEDPDPQLIAARIRQAHEGASKLRERARTHIQANFTLTRRADTLTGIFKKLTKSEKHPSL